MTPRLPIIAALAALAAGAAPAQQTSASPTPPPAAEGGRPYTVAMTGAAERPGPGDPDGGGTAEFRVNAGQSQVCYTLAVTNIEPATLAHIHRGGVAAVGPIVVNLTAPADGGSSAAPRSSARWRRS